MNISIQKSYSIRIPHFSQYGTDSNTITVIWKRPEADIDRVLYVEDIPEALPAEYFPSISDVLSVINMSLTYYDEMKKLSSSEFAHLDIYSIYDVVNEDLKLRVGTISLGNDGSELVEFEHKTSTWEELRMMSKALDEIEVMNSE